MHNCPQYKSGHAEIVLTSKGPVLVYQISDKDTRILIDIQGKVPKDLKQFMKEHILPQLPGKYKHYECFLIIIFSSRFNTEAI